MSWIKFSIWLLLIGGVFATAYYTNTLTALTSQVNVVNEKFFAYIPIEYRYLFSLFIFLLIISIIYKWVQRS